MTDDNNSDFLDDSDPIPEEKLEALKDSLERLVGSNSRLEEETDLVESVLQEYLANAFDGTETEAEVTIEPSIKQLAANQESWMREICAKLSRQEEILDRQHMELRELQEQIRERNDWYEARLERQKNTGFAVMLSVIVAGYLAIFHILLIPSPPKTYTQIEQEAQNLIKEQEAQEARDEIQREAKKATQEQRDAHQREIEEAKRQKSK
jgi:hypothetical protein